MPSTPPLFERLGRLFVRRKGLALLFVASITLLTQGMFWLRIQQSGVPIDFTPQALFIDSGPEVDALRSVENTFGRDDNDVLFQVADFPATDEGIAALRDLHTALAALPNVERVDSPITASILLADENGLAAITPVEDRPAAEALRLLAAAPETQRLLVSEDASVVALRVRLSGDLERVADLAPAVHAVEATARAVPLPLGARLLPAGVPWVRTEVTDRMMNDQLVFVPLVGTLFAVTIVVLFRRFWVGIAPLVAVGVADVWAMGVLVGGGATLNILSILVPTLVLVIGVADGIHITARYREALEGGANAEDAMGETLRTMVLPCFLTTFTTAAGFVSLLVADTTVIRSFGIHSAVAMVVCFFGIMTVLPALLAWIPPAWVLRPATRSDQEGRILHHLDRLVAARPRVVALACCVAAGGCGLVGSGVQPNSRLLEMYRPGSPTWEAVTLSETHLSGVIPVFFALDVPEEDGWHDPDRLARLDALEQAMKDEQAVRWTGSYAGYIRILHGHLSDKRTVLPTSREAIAQEVLVGDMAGGAPKAGVVSEDGRQVRVMGLLADAGGRAFLPMRDRLNARAAEIFADTDVRWVLTGDGLLAAIGINRLITDLVSSLGLMFLVIFLTLTLLIRDAKLAAIACIPNAVPLLCTLGTLGFIGADLQASNVVSFTVAVGLAVDDTIHFIARYKSEREAGRSLPDAITATFHGAGHPIVLTSVLLIVGFGVLTLSDLTSTRHFGLLSSVTMAAALVGDLLLLPSLLYVGRRFLVR